MVRPPFLSSRYRAAIACCTVSIVWMLLTGAQCGHSRNQGQPASGSNAANPNFYFPYDLENPGQSFEFESAGLNEISGLSPTETPGIFSAVADEKGEIYFIDFNKNGALTDTILFRDKGDFEGVEMVGSIIYALKSDGKLFAISRNTGTAPGEYDTQLGKELDMEGLCYDQRRDALLLASKGDPESADNRPVYAFDLKTKKLLPQPVYRINPADVDALYERTGDDKDHAFSPSGIAIHPKTGDVYLISTALKRIVILDYATGKVLFVSRIDKKLLPQPEGIAFDAQGNLYLSSEGKGGKGKMVMFKYQPR